MTPDDNLARKERKKAAHAKNRQKYKDMVNAFKSKPCAICNECYPPVAMDLHHIDPCDKIKRVSQILKHGGYRTIQDELDKCAVLCSVCHRLLHAGLVELECPMSDSNRH